MKSHSLWLAAAVAAASATTVHFLSEGISIAQQKGTTPQGNASEPSLPIGARMPSLQGATQWLGSAPLTREALRGKVVLVDFWTYTCINWLRQLPHVRSWAETYEERGLVVVGVHSPEFSFERNVDNVRLAIETMNIPYPVAVDNDFSVWRAFDNAYWPALYVIDAQGRIRHQRFGEGGYEQVERVIQRLLDEAGNGLAAAGSQPAKLAAVQGVGIEAEADWANLQSPETYLGRVRATNFDAVGSAGWGERHMYALPAALRKNHWALSGDWTLTTEAAVLNRANGRIAYRFHARDLHLVMGPAPGAKPVRFRVSIDGQPPGASHGSDIDARGNGSATQQRLYQLVRQSKPIVERQFEIEFLDSGLVAFAFTFG